MIYKITLLLFALSSLYMPAYVSAADNPEALRLGEIMYRKGILPSGEKMTAVVQGDIEVDGSMFTCVSCHLRSGMGTVEGTVFSLPTNGGNLLSPLMPGHENAGLPSSFKGLPAGIKMFTPWYKPAVNPRPAYTDETLADALRMGVDPTGRRFSPVMPIYYLDDREVKILISYLKSLSSVRSPGVTDATLRFATVVTEGVGKEDREAMLLPIRTFFDLKNSRHDVMRGMKKAMEIKDTAYRKLLLDVWELKGPPESWTAQLEDYYQKKPVFALIGGITAGGEWTPIHRFCEKNNIPCILPITDFPVISDDWYTLYFSKGLYQEAEAVASYLAPAAEGQKAAPVVQVFRNEPEGIALSKDFRKIWEQSGFPGSKDIIIKKGELLNAAFWKKLVAEYKDTVFLLWLGEDDISYMAAVTEGNNKPRSIFVSATLLGKNMNSVPESVRNLTYVAWPYRHPSDPLPPPMMGGTVPIVSAEVWLKQRNLKTANRDISSKMYCLSQLLSEVIMHMQSNFYRDYFLDVFDMLPDQLISADYPRLSFGPGQRYASKGCYIMQLSPGKNPSLIKKSEWVMH